MKAAGGTGQVPERLKGMGCKPIGASLRRFESYPVQSDTRKVSQSLVLRRISRVDDQGATGSKALRHGATFNPIVREDPHLLTVWAGTIKRS